MLSIVIITKNEETHIQRTINSCLATAASEIIIVDSNSHDKTQEIIKSNIEHDKRIKLIAYNTPPFTAARGRGIGASYVSRKSSHILFLDGDMEIVNDFLPAGITELNSDPKLAAIMGQMKNLFYDYNNMLSYVEDNVYNLKKNIMGGAILIKREIYDASGGYNSRLIVNEESELEYKLKRLGYYVKRISNKMINHHTEIPRSFSQIKSRLLDRKITALGINLYLGMRDLKYLHHLIRTNPQVFATTLFLPLLIFSAINDCIELSIFFVTLYTLYIKITSGSILHVVNYITYSLGMIVGLLFQVISHCFKKTNQPN